LQSPNLRDVNRLELIGTNLDTVSHTVDVRHIASNRGRHNIPNLGIFLWRLQNYRITRSRAKAAAAVDDGRYFFDPLGGSAPLAGPAGPLRRRALYADLEALRRSIVSGTPYSSIYFGDTPVFQVWLDNALVAPPRSPSAI